MSFDAKKGAIVSAAGLLALSFAAFAADAPKGSRGMAVSANDMVHCYGVHECKGNGDCKTTENSCKGNNECKGHSFNKMTAKACIAKSGIIGDLIDNK